MKILDIMTNERVTIGSKLNKDKDRTVSRRFSMNDEDFGLLSSVNYKAK